MEATPRYTHRTERTMNGSTPMREIIYHLGVLFVVGVLHTSNCEVNNVYVLINDALPWEEAQGECVKLGRILVKINSQQEFNDLRGMDNTFSNIISGGEVWTGLYTTTETCADYQWDGGFKATWFLWDTEMNEPDFCDDSKCVRLRHGLMRTISCSSSYPFICQLLPEETSTSATTTTSPATTTTTTTATTSATTPSTTPTTEGTTSDSLQQEETSSTNTPPTVAEITTNSLTDSTTTTSKRTSTMALTTEGINTTLTDGSILSEDATTTTTTPTNAEITTITSTEGSSTKTETSSTTSIPEVTTITTDNSMLEKTTTGMVGETTVSSPETLGNITCLCNINMRNTTQRQGIIPSSSAHRSSLLMSGYVPACSESIVWDTGLMSREEKLALLNDLKKHLNVAKNTTSLYKRKLTSVYDNRVSATSVGALGVCLLVGVFGTLVAADASRFYTYCKKHF